MLNSISILQPPSHAFRRNSILPRRYLEVPTATGILPVKPIMNDLSSEIFNKSPCRPVCFIRTRIFDDRVLIQSIERMFFTEADRFSVDTTFNVLFDFSYRPRISISNSATTRIFHDQIPQKIDADVMRAGLIQLNIECVLTVMTGDVSSPSAFLNTVPIHDSYASKRAAIDNLTILPSSTWSLRAHSLPEIS